MSDLPSGHYQVVEVPVNISRVKRDSQGAETGIFRNFKAQDSIGEVIVDYPTNPHTSTVSTAHENDVTYHTSADLMCFHLDAHPMITIKDKTIHPEVAWLHLTGDEITNEGGTIKKSGLTSITFCSSRQEGCIDAVTGQFQLLWAYKRNLLQYRNEVLGRAPDSLLKPQQMASQLQPDFTLVLKSSEMPEQLLCLIGKLDCLTEHLLPKGSTFWTLRQSQEDFATYTEALVGCRKHWDEEIDRFKYRSPQLFRNEDPTIQAYLSGEVSKFEQWFRKASDKLTGPGMLVGLIPVNTEAESQSGDHTTV